MKSRNIISWSGFVIAAALLLAVNIFGSVALRSARYDLTDQKLYTLTEGTRSIVGGLREPVTLKFYYSRSMADKVQGLSTYATRVQELLEEYRDLSKGMIRIEVIDPVPFSEDEDEAARQGLQGIPVGPGGENFFLGLVGRNAIDTVKTIRFFQPDRESFLEYELSELVYNLSNPVRKRVGVMTPLPVLGDRGALDLLKKREEIVQPWLITQQIAALYEIVPVPVDSRDIPKGLDVLLVIHPKGVQDKTWYAIDQWVLKGGKAIFFVDPWCDVDQKAFDPQNPYNALWEPRASTLGPLADAWGLSMDDKNWVGDRKTARRVTPRTQRGTIEPVDFVGFQNVLPDQFASEDVVLAELSNLSLAMPGGLKVTKKENVTVTPLIRSTDASMLIDCEKVQYNLDPVQLLRDFKDSGEKMAYAVRLGGRPSTAFPKGRPTEVEGAEPVREAGHVDAAESDVNLVVVADVDMLADRFWVTVQDVLGQRVGYPSASNGDFLVNLLENMGGSSDLISVRSRGKFTRPFDRVIAMAKKAEEQYRARETELQNSLKETEKRLAEIGGATMQGSTLVISPEQQAEVDKLRDQMAATRKELRNVQLNLRKEVEGLGLKLKLINIGAIPLLVGLLAVALGVMRLNRRKA